MVTIMMSDAKGGGSYIFFLYIEILKPVQVQIPILQLFLLTMPYRLF